MSLPLRTALSLTWATPEGALKSGALCQCLGLAGAGSAVQKKYPNSGQDLHGSQPSLLPLELSDPPSHA